MTKYLKSEACLIKNDRQLGAAVRSPHEWVRTQRSAMLHAIVTHTVALFQKSAILHCALQICTEDWWDIVLCTLRSALCALRSVFTYILCCKNKKWRPYIMYCIVLLILYIYSMYIPKLHRITDSVNILNIHT